MMEELGFQDLSVSAWAYGSGFPKSHNLAKQFEKDPLSAEEVKTWDGWGTALKPAWESLCIGYKRVNAKKLRK